jgi:hypothetical protein
MRFLLALLIGLFAIDCNAYDWTQEDLDTLYGTAAGIVKVNLATTKAPILRMSDEETVCAQVGVRGKCGIKAIYLEGTVWMTYNLNPADLYDQSILLHEEIHYLQEKQAGGPATTCAEYEDREDQAYREQAKFLVKVHRMQGIEADQFYREAMIRVHNFCVRQWGASAKKE